MADPSVPKRTIVVTCPECGKPRTRVYKPGTSLKTSRCYQCAQRAVAAAKHVPADVRFWAKVEKTEGCWLWTGQRMPAGYGRFGHTHGAYTYAHRFAYELVNGPIPEGLNVRHRCDNPPCVNPEHLMLGTQQANMDDKVEKGRQARGPDHHPAARLTEADVLAIRAAWATSGATTRSGIAARRRALAQQYGVWVHTISAIVSRKTWSHLEVGPLPTS